MGNTVGSTRVGKTTLKKSRSQARTERDNNNTGNNKLIVPPKRMAQMVFGFAFLNKMMSRRSNNVKGSAVKKVEFADEKDQTSSNTKDESNPPPSSSMNSANAGGVESQEEIPLFSRTSSKRGKLSIVKREEEGKAEEKSVEVEAKPAGEVEEKQEVDVAPEQAVPVVDPVVEGQQPENAENNEAKQEEETTVTAAAAADDVPPPANSENGKDLVAKTIDVCQSLLKLTEVEKEKQDMKEISAVVIQIRKNLSVPKNPPIKPVVQSGVVPVLVNIMAEKGDYPDLVFECAWALTNVASGSSEDTRCVIDAGALDVFIKLLDSQNDDICDQAVWALGNIAGDSVPLRNLVLSRDIVSHIIKLISRTDLKMTFKRNVAWLLSNLCRSKPSPALDILRSLCGPILELVGPEKENGDPEILTDALWAFSYMSDGNEGHIENVINSGGLELAIVVLKMTKGPSNVISPALRVLGNVVTGNDLHTQVAISLGAVPILKSFLVNKQVKLTLLKEACWSISNIVAGVEAHIQEILDDPDIVDALYDIVATKSRHDDRNNLLKEIAFIFSNMLEAGSPSQIQYLLQKNVFAILALLLNRGASEVAYTGIELLFAKTPVKSCIDAALASDFREKFLLNDPFRPVMMDALDCQSTLRDVRVFTVLMAMGCNPRMVIEGSSMFALAKAGSPQVYNRISKISVITLFCAVDLIPRFKQSVWLPLELVRELHKALFQGFTYDRDDDDGEDEEEDIDGGEVAGDDEEGGGEDADEGEEEDEDEEEADE